MKKILSFVLIILMICSVAFAHKGRTDGAGGHYNRSTGEYHYHHGYPEHQHTNGICPYGYDNKTNSSSSNSTSTNTKENILTINSDERKSSIPGCIFLGILTLALGVSFGLLAGKIYSIKNVKNNNIDKKEKNIFFKIISNIFIWIIVLLIPFYFYALFVLPFYSFTTYNLLLNGNYTDAFIIIVLTVIVIAIGTFINKNDKK